MIPVGNKVAKLHVDPPSEEKRVPLWKVLADDQYPQKLT